MGAGGAPKGSSNNLQSGLYALMKLRKSGKPNGRTSFGKAFARRLNEYVVMYGGDPSPAEMNIMNDTTWVDFYTLSIDMELVGRRLYRRGKVHPLLDVRVKLAAHRRENLKLLGVVMNASQDAHQQYYAQYYGHRRQGTSVTASRPSKSDSASAARNFIE